MIDAIFSREFWMVRGEAMRRFHSRWLTRAVQHGVRPPRIPVRKVTEDGKGGWDALMSTPEGRAWAEEFWQGAFEHPDSK